MPEPSFCLLPDITSAPLFDLTYAITTESKEKISPVIENTNFDPHEIVYELAVALGIRKQRHTEAFLMMIATEPILREEWDTPEEDEAWADLLRER